jgi:hypothetical protein
VLLGQVVGQFVGLKIECLHQVFSWHPAWVTTSRGLGASGRSKQGSRHLIEFIVAGWVSSEVRFGVRFTNLGPTLIRGFQGLEVAVQLLEIVSGIKVRNVHDESSRWGKRER